MERTRHSAEQIAKKLHEAAKSLAGGKIVDEVGTVLGISPATYHRRKKECSGAHLSICGIMAGEHGQAAIGRF